MNPYDIVDTVVRESEFSNFRRFSKELPGPYKYAQHLDRGKATSIYKQGGGIQTIERAKQSLANNKKLFLELDPYLQKGLRKYAKQMRQLAKAGKIAAAVGLAATIIKTIEYQKKKRKKK